MPRGLLEGAIKRIGAKWKEGKGGYTLVMSYSGKRIAPWLKTGLRVLDLPVDEARDSMGPILVFLVPNAEYKTVERGVLARLREDHPNHRMTIKTFPNKAVEWFFHAEYTV